MGPQGWAHAWVSEQLVYRLIEGLRGRARVRVHSPMAASDDSEPEPDVLVCPHDPDEGGHPSRGHLVVEVADTSLRKDRILKAALYVHRGPGPAGYTSVVQVDPDGTLAVEAFPDVSFPVASVLPRS